MPDYEIREALEKLWSASAFIGTETNDRPAHHAGRRGARLRRRLRREPARGTGRRSTDNAFMIVVQDFLDPYTLNVRQLMKCCVEEITPDGRLIPFCAYNSVGYREQVRAEHVRSTGRRRGAQRHAAAAAADADPVRQPSRLPR